MSRRSQQIEMHFQQGQRLHLVGRLAEAGQVYRQVLAAAPAHAEALHAMGALALQAGQAEAALGWIDQAIARKPSVALYHVTRANALLALRRFDAAIAACRTALRHKRNSAEAFQALGHALSDSGQADAALAAYRDAARLQPDLPDIRNNLGAALRQAGLLEQAEQQLQLARRVAPGDPLVLANLSNVLKELGRVADAEAALREALRLAPQHPVLRHNLALLLLLTGRFAEGWDAWEWRFRAGAVPGRHLGQPQWDGQKLDGWALLVHAEQGLGDTIQFCRYVPLLSGPPLSGQVVFEVQPRMARLMRSLAGGARIVTAGESLPQFDLACPLMSLPRLLGMPAGPVPYLGPEPALVAHWRERLGEEGFKVGIAWQGNPHRHEDKGRSIALRHFRPLALIPGVRLISLQKEHGVEQMAAAADVPVETLGDSFDAGPDAFVDAAAVMANLDLVITSDTAIAHLAGALGRPVWVALRAVPDWRWMLERPDSPWYPTMRLFRQAARDDWTQVFAEMARALRERP